MKYVHLLAAVQMALVLTGGPAHAGIADRWGFAFADQPGNAA